MGQDAAPGETVAERIARLGAFRASAGTSSCAPTRPSPKCCTKAAGLESWQYLKKRLAELRLTGAGGIYRTKANCLQVCMQGPIAVVYPGRRLVSAAARRPCSSGSSRSTWSAGDVVAEFVIARRAADPP